MRSIAGARLAGRYEVGELIAEGGMAAVHLGTDTVLGRPVAIKVLASHLAADPSFVARFEREAKAAASLNHPNVVGVFDAGVEDGRHYIVMEYVEGRTLADVLRDGALPPDEVGRIGRAVAAALSAAHAQGIVHRDVKPGNILITPDGTVKVTDFGIARVAQSSNITQTAALIGTALYMSPEQAQGLPVDARSDIYSLGCVLHHAAAGVPPFDGESPIGVAQQHVTAEAPPLPRATPAALRTVIERSMSKQPSGRFPDASALASALSVSPAPTTPYLQQTGAPTERIPHTRTEVIPRRPPPNRVPLFLGAAVLLAVVIAAVAALGRDPVTERELVESPRPESPAPAVTAAPATPAPAPAEPAVSPDDPAAALFAGLSDGARSGQIDAATARALNDRLNNVFRANQRGDTEEALKELEKTRDWIEQRTEKGQIHPTRSRVLVMTLDTLERIWEQRDGD